MREIKFRGKNPKEGWVYGGYFGINGRSFIINFTKDTGGETYHNMYEVDPNTLGQYTEFKGMCGEEIYEGDIVRERVTNYCVMFDPQGYWCLDGNGIANSEALGGHYLEVIGNVFDMEDWRD